MYIKEELQVAFRKCFICKKISKCQLSTSCNVAKNNLHHGAFPDLFRGAPVNFYYEQCITRIGKVPE